MARKVRLFSPIGPIPLARKLKTEMDRKWTSEEKKNGRVMGGGTETEMVLKVERWKSRNDLATRLKASMEQERAGTLIEGRLGPDRGVGCFMLFWLSFVGFFLFIGLIILGSADAPLLFKIGFLAVPTIMLIGGFALFKFGRRNASEDEARILEFLADRVDARPR